MFFFSSFNPLYFFFFENLLYIYIYIYSYKYLTFIHRDKKIFLNFLISFQNFHFHLFYLFIYLLLLLLLVYYLQTFHHKQN